MPWYVKASGAYEHNSLAATENAKMIYAVLASVGWSLNAVSGLLGNVYAESGMNPWRWQKDKIGSSAGSPWTGKGYGLVQFTPASKYIDNANTYPGYGANFSNRAGKVTDGHAQLLFINDNADYMITTEYPLTYDEFKKSDAAAWYLSDVWLANYERPKYPEQSRAERREKANYYYSFLSGEPVPDPPPMPPHPIPPVARLHMPLIFYMKRGRKFK